MQRATWLASIFFTLTLASPSVHAFRQWDYADLFYMPGEDGWGVNVAQQNDTLFATLFVYGPDRKPTWYVASSLTYAGIQDDHVDFTGTLYQTTGPWFGASTFDPRTVTTRAVGTIKFEFPTPAGGWVVYSIDGVSYSKEIRRQTWKAIYLDGSYVGTVVGRYCGSGDGYKEEPATFTASIAGTTATIAATVASRTCTYTGDYVQFGRAGVITGSGENSMTCTDGSHGSFQFNDVQANAVGFTAAGVTFGSNCMWSGHMGGVLRSELPN